MANPKRGEVWLVDLGYVAKTRPCLVLSVPILDQDRAVVAHVAHTTNLRGSRFEVQVPVKFLDPGAFEAQNLIMPSLPRSIRKFGELKPDQLKQVEDAVRHWLGL
jgi:mRNA interferase MazF